MDPQVIREAIPEILTQLLAFLLVLWILKKYAFGAVFKILEERQKTIAHSLDEAEKQRQDMESLRKDYEARIQVIEQEGRQKIQEAIQGGQRIAGEIREKAQTDAADQVERAKMEIAREVDKAKAVMRTQIVELSTIMAEKLLEKNLSTQENQKFVEEVLSRSEDLS